MSGVTIAPLDVLMSLVTLRSAVVAFRLLTVQPRVPLILRVCGITAVMGQTIPALSAELRIGAQD